MIILVMGVSGSGKTTVGRLLSEDLGWKYFDADDFHSPANVEKMRRGVPLTDADRGPWLESLARLIREKLDAGQPAILACSALKQTYRDKLLIDDRVRLVYLKGDYQTIGARLRDRGNHYMNPKLLTSQFETLEEPTEALELDVKLLPETLVESIKQRLNIQK